MSPRSGLPTAARRRRWGRRIAVSLTVVVLLAVGAIAGGGFYFAGQIESIALQPPASTPPPHYDLAVDGYAQGEVVLHRTGKTTGRDLLTSGDDEGLRWPGGSGVLTGTAQRLDGEQVRRTLQVVTGIPPAPGTPAGFNSEVWSDPQAAYGAAYQQVTYPCAGGTCPAWFVPGPSTTWMVLVHGKGASMSEPLRAMGPALKAGLPVLDIGYRNDAGAPVDPSGRYRYGATEWRDLEQAVRYATAHGAQHVVLFGSSMGGAIVASFLEHSSSASLVRGVVLDAPALDFRAIVDYAATQRTVPLLGTPVPGPVTWAAERIAGARYDVDWTALDYVDASWLRVPALVFHGTGDLTVPVSVSDRLRAAHPDLVAEVRVPGAGHVASWNVAPEAYAGRESAFLGCVVAGAPTPSCRIAG